ncbi:gamma-glutamylcyclotransferase-like, partial [Saccoglossus kowalevskii]|uniref:gamma-glutamylcyclotransferase n=1 Tax=Saccoglossus kowalevskii TaxID=10224 RepID=A0ABM0MXS0_SACKO
NYKLVFNDIVDYVSPWHGAIANIIPSSNDDDDVWGVIHEFDKQTAERLTKNLTGSNGIYQLIRVTVKYPDNRTVDCSSFELRNPLPGERRPSPQYLSMVVAGAMQKGLPEEYTNKLKRVVHNSHEGPISLDDKAIGELTY